MENHRTIVVGAGPAGASLSFLLARRGIEVVLLERNTDFAREFRGEGLVPSGIDALRQMGLPLERLPQSRIEAIEIFAAGHKPVRMELPAGEEMRVVSQPALLEMLVTEAARFSGFRIERGATVREVTYVGKRVAGIIADSRDRTLELRADLIIGADGRSSVIRKRSGLHEVRNPQEFDVVWCKVPMAEFMVRRGAACAYIWRDHGALAFPSYDGRLQIGWAIRKGAFVGLRRRGIEAWVTEMAAYVEPELAAHLRANSTAITQPFVLDVICDRLVKWTRPGLLLIGDAAHPMSPVGAQGINMALRDALVAANLLVPALLGGAGASELDAAALEVSAQRMSEVTAIQRAQRISGLAFGESWYGKLLIALILKVLARPWIATRLFNVVRSSFASGTSELRLTV